MYFASVLVLDHLISYIAEPGDGIHVFKITFPSLFLSKAIVWMHTC